MKPKQIITKRPSQAVEFGWENGEYWIKCDDPIGLICEYIDERLSDYEALDKGETEQMVGFELPFMIGMMAIQMSVSHKDAYSLLEQAFNRMKQIDKAHVEDAIASVNKKWTHLIKYWKLAEAIRQSGWLPLYDVTAVRLIFEHGSDNLDSFFDEYYRSEWTTISKGILSRLDQYTIDDEAKCTLREALIGHEAKLYRLVCTGLFPAIERNLPKWIGGKKNKGGLMDKIENWANSRTIGDLMSLHVFRDVYMNYILSHSFVSENRDQGKKIDRSIPVPNRNAVAHGFVQYNTHKHSVNMLLLADYIFSQVSTYVPVLNSGESNN